MTPDRVTTVVVTRDRWPDLRRTLPRHAGTVIVVDNDSRDGTPELVRRHFPAVELVALRRNLGAVARNVGVGLARTPYVAFSDDDSWWRPDALDHAADLLDDCPELAVVAGHTIVRPGGRADPVCELMRSSPLGRCAGLPGPVVLGFLACSAVVRKVAFEAVGGFDELLHFMGEEELLALDLTARGWSLCYVESVVAYHEPSPSRDVAARRARAGRNRLLTAVMRRPWPVVRQRVRQELGSGRPGRAALRQALPRLPRALWRRRPLPLEVESMQALLERTGARRAR
jgi:GT2 family glycosyltransferase